MVSFFFFGGDSGSAAISPSDYTSFDGDNSEWIFYRLTAFGRTFHFNVTLNRWLMSPSFRVEQWNRHGVVDQTATEFPAADEEHPVDCYYVGYVAKQEVTSRVAISNCRGLVRRLSDELAAARYKDNIRQMNIGHAAC